MSAPPDLDHAFLAYTGVTFENQKPARRFYVPLFEGRRTVVDLGCGGGSFVALLIEAGVEAVGVDSDPASCAAMRARGLPVIEQDALAYLESVEAGSLDGVYSAHLVEHLPYEVVLRMIQLAYRALKPGGRIVMATPDPRSLYSHLEMYHLHFGHKAFYHPRLLCFFLEYCGFEQIEYGQNPFTTPLRSKDLFGPDNMPGQANYRRHFPPATNPMQSLLRTAKTTLFRLLAQPFLDDLQDQVNRALAAQLAAIQRTGVLDQAFECYASGFKPPLNRDGDQAEANGVE